MRSLEVVVLHPGFEFAGAVVGGLVDEGIGPFKQQGLDEALGLAVGPPDVRASSNVPDPESPQQLGEAA